MGIQEWLPWVCLGCVGGGGGGYCKDFTEEATPKLDRKNDWSLQVKKQGGSPPGRGHYYMQEPGGVRETTAGIK